MLRYFDIAWLSKCDGPGTRLVIFFQECNLRCKWCHSPHSWNTYSPILLNKNLCTLCGKCLTACKYNVHQFIDNKHIIISENCKRCGKCIDACPIFPSRTLVLPTKEISVEDLYNLVQPQLRLLRNIGGVTLSGGEALLQYQDIRKFLQLCKNNGIHTAVETNGLLPLQNYKHVSDLVDCWLIGIRGITEDSPEFIRLTENIDFLSSTNKQIIARLPVVCGYTDYPIQLITTHQIMAKFSIKDIHLLPFNINTSHYYESMGIDFDLDENVAPTREHLNEIKQFFENANYNVKIL